MLEVVEGAHILMRRGLPVLAAAAREENTWVPVLPVQQISAAAAAAELELPEPLAVLVLLYYHMYRRPQILLHLILLERLSSRLALLR